MRIAPAQSGARGGSLLTAMCECRFINSVQGTMHSLWPPRAEGDLEPPSLCYRSPCQQSCKGSHAGGCHPDAFCNSTSLQTFCLQSGEFSECLQLVKCQVRLGLQQLLCHRRFYLRAPWLGTEMTQTHRGSSINSNEFIMAAVYFYRGFESPRFR